MANILLRITFLLINLHFVVGPAEIPPGEPTTNSNGVLPIIFIKSNGKYLYPTNVEQSSLKKRLSFSSQTHTKERFFCPAETTKQKEEIVVGASLSELYSTLNGFHSYIQKNYPEYEEYLKYLEFSEYCLFKKTFKSGDQLTCLEEPKFGLRRITRKRETGEEEAEQCGPNNVGIMYEFFYLACPPTTTFNKLNISSWMMYVNNESFRNYINKLPFLTVKHVAYRFCYNHQENDTIYTRHRLRSNELLFDEKTKYDREKHYEMSIDNYNKFDKNVLENLKNVYEKVEKLSAETFNVDYSDTDEKVPPESFNYKGHQLVSEVDFSTALWRKPTHHYLNVKPMHTDLFALWNYIEELIIKHYKTLNIELEVYTGTFYYKSENKRPVKYLYDNQVRVPDIWIKLIHEFDRKSPYVYGTAITLYNYKATEPDPCHDSGDICHPFIDDGIVGKLFPGAGDQICCEKIAAKHLEYFNLKMDVRSALMIESLSYHRKNGNINFGSKTTTPEENVAQK